MTIDPTMTPAEALARLYNRARPQGMGFLAYTPEPMRVTEAQAMIDQGQYYFDYVGGRVMKVSLKEIQEAIDNGSGDFRLFDRDNGPGAAMGALTIGDAPAA